MNRKSYLYWNKCYWRGIKSTPCSLKSKKFLRANLHSQYFFEREDRRDFNCIKSWISIKCFFKVEVPLLGVLMNFCIYYIGLSLLRFALHDSKRRIPIVFHFQHYQLAKVLVHLNVLNLLLFESLHFHLNVRHPYLHRMKRDLEAYHSL